MTILTKKAIDLYRDSAVRAGFKDVFDYIDFLSVQCQQQERIISDMSWREQRVVERERDAARKMIRIVLDLCTPTVLESMSTLSATMDFERRCLEVWEKRRGK